MNIKMRNEKMVGGNTLVACYEIDGASYEACRLMAEKLYEEAKKLMLPVEEEKVETKTPMPSSWCGCPKPCHCVEDDDEWEDEEEETPIAYNNPDTWAKAYVTPEVIKEAVRQAPHWFDNIYDLNYRAKVRNAVWEYVASKYGDYCNSSQCEGKVACDKRVNELFDKGVI